mmetsp:Transcript_43277/g.78789  ORF Transcript_43277/g.78789 Transcript_43277/m.78789 type:complete len:281 (+) Transcript_43277:1150-1992(+)
MAGSFMRVTRDFTFSRTRRPQSCPPEVYSKAVKALTFICPPMSSVTKSCFAFFSNASSKFSPFKIRFHLEGLSCRAAHSSVMIKLRSSEFSVASHISKSRVLDTPHLSLDTASRTFFCNSVLLSFMRSRTLANRPPAESAMPRSIPGDGAFAERAAAVAAASTSSLGEAPGESEEASPSCASLPSAFGCSPPRPLLTPPNFALCSFAAARDSLSCDGSLSKFTIALALSRMVAPTSWPPCEYSNMKSALNFICLPTISLTRSSDPCFKSTSAKASPFWIR